MLVAIAVAGQWSMAHSPPRGAKRPKQPKRKHKVLGERLLLPAVHHMGPPHAWFSFGHYKWRCLLCHARAYSAFRRRALDLAPCPRSLPHIDDIIVNPRLHNLQAFEQTSGCIGSAFVLACSSCGAWTSNKLVKLSSPCHSFLLPAGKRALKLLGEGRHPNTYLPEGRGGQAIQLALA